VPSHRLVRKDHLIIIVVVSTLVISISSVSNYGYFDMTKVVYGQPDSNQMSSNTTSSLNIQNIPLKKVHVGDIDIAYKMFGKGDPILLIQGAGGSMDSWEPSVLKELTSNHTVIIFDNRGVGNTTAGTKQFSIQQFANDTVGLLETLKIQKADVLGYSLGSFIAQQLAVTHPDKVNRLMLIATTCGGKESIPPNPEPQKMVIDVINKIANDTPVTSQEVKALLSDGYGSGWLKLHPNFLETMPIPKAKDLFPSITPNNNLKQFKAALDWQATNWNGVCEELRKISIPTLIITGTDDTIPTQNALIIAGKIPGAWLIQIKDAGHAIPLQYPAEVAEILNTFLTTTDQSS
jgi:pimeloyl-ACP methyl ester carboxylesterase